MAPKMRTGHILGQTLDLEVLRLNNLGLKAKLQVVSNVIRLQTQQEVSNYL